MKIIVHTDGSCDWKTRQGGIGIHIQVHTDQQNRKIETHYYKGFYDTTIGRMELMGILMALRSINSCKCPIIIYCDSKYAVNTAQMSSKQFEEKLFLRGTIKNSDIIQLMLEEKKKFSNIQVLWVKGHNNTEFNEIADVLANKGFRDIKERKIEDKNIASKKITLIQA
jgi:ribonuclease HI